MQKNEIKVFECSSIWEAERLYFLWRNQGWRIHKPIKLVWSWRKFRQVAMFEMKDNGYDMQDYLIGLSDAFRLGAEAFKQHHETFKQYREAKNQVTKNQK